MLNFKVNNLKILGLLNKLINFALLSLAEFDQFDSFPGGKIEIRDQLSPTGAEFSKTWSSSFDI